MVVQEGVVTSKVELGLRLYWDGPWDRRMAFWWFELAEDTLALKLLLKVWSAEPQPGAQTYWIRACNSKRCPGDSTEHSSWSGTGLGCPPGKEKRALLLWREIQHWATLVQETVEISKTRGLPKKDLWVRVFIEAVWIRKRKRKLKSGKNYNKILCSH